MFLAQLTNEIINSVPESASEAASQAVAPVLENLTNTATGVLEQGKSFVASINWSSPSWDLFIVIFALLATFIYGFSLGRSRLIVLMVSVYMSLAVVNAAPFLSKMPITEIGAGELFVVKISTFLAVFIALFFLVSRTALLKTITSSDASGGPWWQMLLFSFLQVGLLISVILSFLPPEAVEKLAPFTKQIFSSELARFVWIVLPIAAMALIRSEESNEKS